MEGFAAVETRLALELPNDYKRLVCAYGSGSWKGFLWVLNPFSPNPYLNLLEQAQRHLDAERVIRAGWPADAPFALYPERGGLFPWGMTDNGDRLYWLTEGDPGYWPTVVYESRGPRYDFHRLGCCEFLLRWVAGELRVSVFPDDFEYGFAGAFAPIEAA
ncbi:SMI1/KNR4 family protein [Tautonia marina]|uniref:SMI1/KNR4 family protein n=1 Tax=Tautonia marina TaxID=2653855 RepID=UPI0013764783|nr:SMI1/KNR4 family protein [Tautonia marina]